MDREIAVSLLRVMDEVLTPSPTTSVVVAAFTWSLGRMLTSSTSQGTVAGSLKSTVEFPTPVRCS
jgi:hypothetical protein